MRTKRNLETIEQWHERFEMASQKRIDATAAEDKAIDEMVKRSIRLHGA